MCFLTFSWIWLCYCVVFFFFFKQKTAYEMRISDWSSDVCSSDLVGIASGRLIGFEMLMRWESPEYGLIPPERFIPVAEESGLIGELSLQVIREAMEKIGRASCRERVCQYV